MTDIKSEKTRRRSNFEQKNGTASGRRCVIFQYRHKVSKNDTTSGRHKVIFNTDIMSEKMTRRAGIKSFFNNTTDIKSFFQTYLKLADVVSFFNDRHKVRKK
jgi:hypothetical protein